MDTEQMSVDEIIHADLKKNHVNSNVTFEEVSGVLAFAIQQGEKLMREGNTLFLVKDLEDGGVEFHSINGERGSTLLKNVLAFFKSLKDAGYSYALTYYDNPKINDLLFALKDMVAISKIDEGEFKTYKAVVRI